MYKNFKFLLWSRLIRLQIIFLTRLHACPCSTFTKMEWKKKTQPTARVWYEDSFFIRKIQNNLVYSAIINRFKYNCTYSVWTMKNLPWKIFKRKKKTKNTKKWITFVVSFNEICAMSAVVRFIAKKRRKKTAHVCYRFAVFFLFEYLKKWNKNIIDFLFHVIEQWI